MIVSLTEAGEALKIPLAEVQKRVACDTGLSDTAFKDLNQTLSALIKHVNARIPE